MRSFRILEALSTVWMQYLAWSLGQQDVAGLIQLLRSASSDSEMRPTLIRDFQKQVWNFDGTIHSESVDRVICDLAYDLDYYDPDPLWRKQDSSFYGEKRVAEEISAALLELQTVGLKTE
jgi:hypothetical protein